MSGRIHETRRIRRVDHRGLVVVAPATPAAIRPFQAHLGQLAHKAIATCLLDARRNHTAPAVDPAVLAATLEADPLRHDRRRGQLLLRSYVRSYLESFLPPPPWHLEGAERRIDDGRIDLLFRNAATDQILGDELKTARGKAGVLDPEDREQVARYLAFLEAEFGSRLVGVRLVRLGPPTEAILVRSSVDPRLTVIGGVSPVRW